MWIADLWNLTSWRYEKNTRSVVSWVDLTQVLIFNFCNTCSQTLFYGSFCRYRGTDYIHQKKLHNQTIKLLGELYCLVPLFFGGWPYLLKDPAVGTPAQYTHLIIADSFILYIAAACKVPSHWSQRKIMQHSLSLHFHCFLVRVANPYWLLV